MKYRRSVDANDRRLDAPKGPVSEISVPQVPNEGQILLDKAVARSHKEIRISGLNVLINEHSRSGFSVFSRQPCFPDADAASRFLTSGYIRWKWLNHTGKLPVKRAEAEKHVASLRSQFGKLRLREQIAGPHVLLPEELTPKVPIPKAIVAKVLVPGVPKPEVPFARPTAWDRANARYRDEIRASGLTVLINDHDGSVLSLQCRFSNESAAAHYLRTPYSLYGGGSSSYRVWLSHTGKLRFNRIEVDRCITHLREEFGKLRIFEQKGSQLRVPDWAPYPII